MRATRYVTIAERTPRAEDLPGAGPEMLVAGSLVFTPTTQPVALDQFLRWWRYERGADWRHQQPALARQLDDFTQRDLQIFSDVVAQGLEG